MRGRKPKPAHLKLLNGNAGHRKINPEPRPASAPKAPPAPAYLSIYGREVLEKLAPELHAVGMLTKVDTKSFAVYVEAYSQWRTAVELLNGPPPPTPTPTGFSANGVRMENPLIGVSRKAGELMVKVGSDFGLSPAARCRLHVSLTTPTAGVDRRVARCP
jgi:P27 family predicted phage terminase small subunit